MITKHDKHISVASMVLAAFLLSLSFASQAAYVFTGQNIDVTYAETGWTDLTDSIVAGANTPDIAYNDGSAIGNGLMLDFEFIEIGDNTITFQIRGDDTILHSENGSDKYFKTGLGGGYEIKLLTTDFSIGSVSIDSMTGFTGVVLGTEITNTGKSIFFDISNLGILETTGADLGSS